MSGDTIRLVIPVAALDTGAHQPHGGLKLSDDEHAGADAGTNEDEGEERGGFGRHDRDTPTVRVGATRPRISRKLRREYRRAVRACKRARLPTLPPCCGACAQSSRERATRTRRYAGWRRCPPGGACRGPR